MEDPEGVINSSPVFVEGNYLVISQVKAVLHGCVFTWFGRHSTITLTVLQKGQLMENNKHELHTHTHTHTCYQAKQ